MRSVASALDTGHASLYVYVANTEDLHAQVLDAELASLDLSSGDRPWRDDLVRLLVDYGRLLLSHAEIARMAIRTRPNGPNSAALVEAILRDLARGGITGQVAAWGVDILLQYPAAVAAEHGATTDDASADRVHDRGHTPDRAVDSASYPLTSALAHELYSGTPEARAEWALNILIDGLLAAVSHNSEN